MRLYFRGAMRPVRLEFAVRDAHVSVDVPVVDDEVVARARFKKLLLNRQPRGFIQPQLDLGKLLLHFIGLWQQLQAKNLSAVDRSLQSPDLRRRGARWCAAQSMAAVDPVDDADACGSGLWRGAA